MPDYIIYFNEIFHFLIEYHKIVIGAVHTSINKLGCFVHKYQTRMDVQEEIKWPSLLLDIQSSEIVCVNVVTLFPSSLTAVKNKLECFSR